MILTKEIEIHLNQFKSHYYKRLGYDVNDKNSIVVKIEDIGKGSTLKIKAKCDICNNIKEISYRKYLKNVSKYDTYACSNKCAVSKGEMTCLEKYGTKYALQNEEIKEKTKKYFLETYGVENTSQLESNKSKREKTMLEKFGVKTNIILPETHQKAIEMSKTPKSKEKRERTMLEKFGVTNPMKSKKIYDSFKATNLKKYGHEYPAQNESIYNKTQLSGKKVKYYNEIRYQGSYELDFLKKCKEIGILDKISRSKSIRYNLNNENKIYYPDFYIKSLNLLIEIKSQYYYDLVIEKNIAKKNSCLNQGYKFLFIINKDYSEFIKLIQTGI